jgi:hypothetical protein
MRVQCFDHVLLLTQRVRRHRGSIRCQSSCQYTSGSGRGIGTRSRRGWWPMRPWAQRICQMVRVERGTRPPEAWRVLSRPR